MQLPLFGDQASSLAVVLTDPQLDEAYRVQAGDQLIREIESNHGTFEELALITDSLALGMRLLCSQKRHPERAGGFVFTDLAILRLSNVFTALGERLQDRSIFAVNRSERALVDEMLETQGYGGMFDAFCGSYDELQLDQLAEHSEMLSKNMSNIAEAGDDTIAEQSVKLDIPLYLLAQLFLAVGWRMEQVTEYSLPPLD